MTYTPKTVYMIGVVLATPPYRAMTKAASGDAATGYKEATQMKSKWGTIALTIAILAVLTVSMAMSGCPPQEPEPDFDMIEPMPPEDEPPYEPIEDPEEEPVDPDDAVDVDVDVDDDTVEVEIDLDELEIE